MMTPHAFVRRKRIGMTMLEMMVAVVVLLTMSLVVYETLSSTIEFNEVLSMRDATTRSARSTLSTLKRELSLAYLSQKKDDPERLETVFVAFDNEPDQLHFSTLAHQRLYVDSRESDQTEITVWAESAPRDVGDGYILYHREAPRVDDEPGLGGRVYPLAYNVRSFSARFMDPSNNEWRDDWDTRATETEYRLPRAIELGLVLIAQDPSDPDRNIEVPFLSRFIVQYGQRLLPNFLSLNQVANGTDGGATTTSDAENQTPQNPNKIGPLGGGPPIPQGVPVPAPNSRRNRNRTRNTRTSTPTRPTASGSFQRGGQ